jgi:hypothetical protein
MKRDPAFESAHRSQAGRRAGPLSRIHVVLATLVVAVWWLALPAAGQSAVKKNREALPDLVISDGTLGGPPFIFWGERRLGSVTIRDTTENRGSGRASPSLTKVYLRHGTGWWLLADRAVGALPPGSESAGEDDVVPGNHHFPPGVYSIVICADAKRQVAERNEHNNCRRVREQFYVAVRSWAGSLSGTALPQPAWTERWTGAGSFDYDLYAGAGRFLYLFSGTVQWFDSFTDSQGCRWGGSGEESFAHDDQLGGLTIDYRHDLYESQGLLLPSSESYVVADSCGSASTSGPLEHTFWMPSLEGTVALAFGSTTLPGSPNSVFDTTYVWRLRAVDPS